MIVGLTLSEEFTGTGAGSDPSRIASTVVQGVGFLAGGVIFTRGAHVRGMTTPTGIWVTAAFGLLIVAGYFTFAFVEVVAATFVLIPLRWHESDVFKLEHRSDSKSVPGSESTGQSSDSAID